MKLSQALNMLSFIYRRPGNDDEKKRHEKEK